MAAAVVVFGAELIRTAWICDDAYITFRTVDNLIHGYGMRWNVDERVQGFTHPLWMLLVAVPYFVTREPYFTAIALNVLLSLTAMTIYVRAIAASTTAAVLGVLVLTASAAFTDFSTSGLENSLEHALLAVFLAVYWRERQHRRFLWLGGSVALLMITRIDTALLVLPCALQAWLASRDKKRDLRDLVVALLPLVAWELFSVIYFGFPFPNTAYAKLKTGVPPIELRFQGFLYLFESLNADPVTLGTIVTGIVAALFAGPANRRALAMGMALHLAYVVNIGGDFMSGRFLTPTLFCAVALLGSLPLAALDVAWPVPAALVLVCVGAGSRLTTGQGSGGYTWISPSRVTNERAFYFPTNGLVNYRRGAPWPSHEWAARGRAARAGHDRVIVEATVGMFAFEAGPAVHVIDPLGLTDPLTARLPAKVRWQTGHFGRRIPEGYPRSIEDGPSAIVDPGVRGYDEALRLIVSGSIWTRARLAAIWRMNTGGYEALLDRYGQMDVPLSAVALRLPEGLQWDAPGTIHWDEVVRPPDPHNRPAPEILYERGIRIDFDTPRKPRAIDLSVSGNDNYIVTLFRGDTATARLMTAADPVSDGALSWRALRVPRLSAPVDHLVILARAGDFRYSLGHVRIIE